MRSVNLLKVRKQGLIALAAFGVALIPAAGAAPQAAPHTILIDGQFLAQVKAEHDSTILAAVRYEADKYLRQRPLSVTDKKEIPPSGDKHDYISLATYWWPNPNTPNHLPYIRRDGEHNPEAAVSEDHVNFIKLSDSVHALALGYYLTGNEAYATHASLLLSVWFLDPKTRMNPNLKYAQAIRGLNDGRGTGIIDTRAFAEIVDGLAMLSGSTAWTLADDTALHGWMTDYFTWLTTSDNGKDEAAAKNNHGNWYDVQAAAIASYLGDTQFVRTIAETAKKKRIDLQIEPSGAQPLEEARTSSFSYSTFSLEALMKLAAIARPTGVDLWSYTSPRGGSIRRAVDYLMPFALKPSEWKHQTISGFKPMNLRNDLLLAAVAYKSPVYEQAAKSISSKEDAQTLLLEHQFDLAMKTGTTK
jgi:hypothetical protein